MSTSTYKTADDLIAELTAEGWESDKGKDGIRFWRNGVRIEAHPFHVSVEYGSLFAVRRMDRYAHGLDRLGSLLGAAREYARMADDGRLEKMQRWKRVQGEMERLNWQLALDHPEALEAIEEILEAMK